MGLAGAGAVLRQSPSRSRVETKDSGHTEETKDCSGDFDTDTIFDVGAVMFDDDAEGLKGVLDNDEEDKTAKCSSGGLTGAGNCRLCPRPRSQ